MMLRGSSDIGQASMMRSIVGFRILFLALGLVSILTGVFALWKLGSARVVIEWSTGSELDTAGFNLYRSGSADGTYEQINTTLIPASDDPLSGGQYSYEDTGVKAGETYYYLLEDVEYSGQATRSGPTEVVARGSSGWELVLALLLMGVSVYGLVATRSHGLANPRPAENLQGTTHES